jgi:SulP family sulfate permease
MPVPFFFSDMAIDVPRTRGMTPFDVTASSPRRTHVHLAAASTLKSAEVVQSTRWQNFKQPLPLILQTFQGMTIRNEDFWFQAVKYFKRRDFAEGTVLFRKGVCCTFFLHKDVC